MKSIIRAFCLLAFGGMLGQEVLAPMHIKTIQFKAQDSQSQFPIVKIGEPFTLVFDDLNPQERDYYYTIEHCDYHWKPSGLLKSEYLGGMDDLRIASVQHSYATLQPYTHYSLTLPNADTQLLLTGNYILYISDPQGNKIFSKRFVVYAPQVTVQMSVVQTRQIKYIDQKQSVQFSIVSPNEPLQTSDTSVKVCILQNYMWENAKTDLKPQYYLSNKLVYKYDKETSFFGGNEYFYFENRDMRTATSSVYHNGREGNQYQTLLFTNTPRADLPYTYNPDINGDFVITTDQGTNPAIEAEYAWVRFSLKTPELPANQKIYVYGAFSGNSLTPEYELQYNPEKGIYQADVFLKQGFYNYKFALSSHATPDFNAFSGNFSQTENDYTILVYYRPVGALYDRVIGVGNLLSTRISRQ